MMMMIPLFAAVKSGNIRKLEQLIAQVPHADVRPDYRYRTALHLAVEQGHVDVAAMLIDWGVDLAAKDCGGFTALHLAAELGHDKIVGMLLEKNPKLIAIRGYDNSTCLHLAVIGGHAAVLKRLLAVDFNLRELEERQTPLLQVAVEYGHEEVIAMLVESAKSKSKKTRGMEDIFRKETFGQTMLHCAIKQGYDRIATQLLAEIPGLINDTHECEETALHLAARYGREILVGQLLAEQPHLIGVLSSNSGSALHVAAQNGQERIVSQLLAAKPAGGRQRTFGYTPLHVAKDERVAALLLAHHPEWINLRDRCGSTALKSAVSRGRSRTVACLLAHGAVGVNEEMFWQVLQWSRENLSELVDAMLTNKPELIQSVHPYNHNSVLHDACEHPGMSKEVLQKILQMSPPEALHNKLNRSNETPFEVAIRSSNKLAIEFLEWKLSLDEILESFRRFPSVCLPPLLDQLYGCVLESLNKDVTGIVWEYLGIEPRDKTRRSKGKNALR